VACSCHLYQVPEGYFTRSLEQSDPAVDRIVGEELSRQQDCIELIASENIVSQAVLQAQGSVLTNKYAEGYPDKRYYHGCECVDEVEKLAIERACALFGCRFANVQPHSGSQANQAVYLAFLHPGDTLMGMSLSSGGHLTHGAKVSLSGKFFNCVAYDVDEKTQTIDYDAVEKLALEHQPKLIIAGGSAYPRVIDFERFSRIAKKTGALLMVDMAHFAGLVAGGVYPSPFPFADIVTTTTHKTLRGPRGGMILTNNEELAKKINSAVFPGVQGGPLMHVIAAKAVAFGEALRPSFKLYARQIVENAKVLADTLQKKGIDLVSKGTDSHLLLVDLRSTGLTGKQVSDSLQRAHITCNKNAIPFDPLKPTVTSGIRLGTPAMTTRGFGLCEFEAVGQMICDIIEGLQSGDETASVVEEIVRQKAISLCRRFPIYP
jgi:glycine hydroxymethyltransferase